MTKRLFFTLLLLSASIVSACTDNDDNTKTPNNQQQVNQPNDNSHGTFETKPEETVSTITQAEALKNVKEQLETDLAVVLPKELPVTEGTFLTATTKVKEKQVEIVFFESETYMPINDIKLKNSTEATVIAKLLVTQYDSVAQANEQIAFEEYSQNGGQQVDLGFNMKGYQDAGAGSLWTGWNEGRWALATHTRTDNPEAGVKLAKQAVQFLETHTLPIPNQNGFAHLDVYKSGNLIVWQDGKRVYTLDSIKEPMEALAIATAFHH
ncbi:hypothetical protein ACQKII_08460 [Lysinibacillus sp. NPDC048646]|uniref:hypothetical protein n=1 Tax=Lysinibacillus sp. NPDC048646 TaxID=3390574 RepID=UPI003CFC91FD